MRQTLVRACWESIQNKYEYIAHFNKVKAKKIQIIQEKY